MPSEKILEGKKKQVEEIKELLTGAASVVLVDYKGIDVANDTKLRAELREAGVEYLVLKNSILKFAFEAVGMDEFVPQLHGTTAIAVSKEDPIAAAKVVQKYSDSLKEVFNVKMGYVDGKFLSVEEVKSVATLPSRETLIAMVAGSFNSIIASFARAISEVAKKQEQAA